MRGSSRGGNRGGQFGRGSRGRDRNDRPPRYNKVEREVPAIQAPYDTTPREFTNTSYKSPASAYEGTANDGKNMQVGPAGAADTKGRQTSQDVVISNKENVQTISVTITNTTTERKSYAKERHGKPGGGRGYGQNAPGEVSYIGDKTKQMLEAPPEHDADSTVHGPDSQQGGDNFQSRQDYREQTRPKRYSSQRQRNAPETGYPEQPPPVEQKPPPPLQQQTSVNTGTGFYNQAVYPRAPPATFYHADQPGAPPRPPRPPGPPPQDTAPFGTPMMQPPIPFHLPVSVSSPGIPSPQRLFAPRPAGAPPPPVPISSAAPPLLAAPYLAAPGVIYTTPPPPPGAPAPYQIPLGYTSPPPAAPPPAALSQPPVASPPQTQSEMYRGGTTYYPPYLQQPPGRSPARRPKVAIPIVDPLEAKKNNVQDRPEQRQVKEVKDMQPPQQTSSHQPQQVQMQRPQEVSTLPQDASATEKHVSPALVKHMAHSSAESMESASVEPKAPPSVEREIPVNPPVHASNDTGNVIGGNMHKGVNVERVVSPSVEHIAPAAPTPADESSSKRVQQNISSPPEADLAPSYQTPIISTDSVESEAVRSKIALPDLQPSAIIDDSSEANVPLETSQLQSKAEAIASS